MSNKNKMIEFENKVYEYLKAEKYPTDAIVPQYKIGKFTTDFTIIDNKTKEIIAVFELKMIKKDSINNNQLSGFNSFISQLIRENGKTVSVFYIIPEDSNESENEEKFSINKLIHVDDGSETRFEFQEIQLPAYEKLVIQSQVALGKDKDVLKQEENISDSIQFLNKFSLFSAPTILGIWFYFKHCVKQELTFVDFSFFALASVVAILPHIKKLEISNLAIIELRGSRLDKESNR